MTEKKSSSNWWPKRVFNWTTNSTTEAKTPLAPTEDSSSGYHIFYFIGITRHSETINI